MTNAHDDDKPVEPVDDITDKEKEDIRREVRAKLMAERKKSKLQLYREQEERRLRMVEGMVVGGALDEMVRITLDLAKHSDKCLVNMVPYWHGQTYTVPRHVANSLAEAMFRGWQHQFEIDGKTRFDFYQSARETTISPVRRPKNMPVRPDGPVNQTATGVKAA